MIRANKKVCYLVTLTFVLLSLFFGYIFFKEEEINVYLVLGTLFSMISITYLLYMFLPAKKIYAYVNALLSTIIIDIAFFWRPIFELIKYEIRYYQGHKAVSDMVIDAYIFINAPVVFSALLFPLVYLLVYYMQKNKPVCKTERGNINEN